MKILTRILTACILLLAAGLAQAQAPRPACYPLINGYPAGVPRVEFGQVGTHVYWPCSDSKGAPPTWWGFSCPNASCSSTAALSGVISRITRASAKVGTANAEWDKAVAYDCARVQAEQTARGALCRERAATLRANLAAWAQ